MTRCLFLLAIAFTLLSNAAADAPHSASHTDESATDTPPLKHYIDELSLRLRAEAIITGTFTQQRFVKKLQAPLTSSGLFIYWRDQGIYWQTDSPFPQSVTYTTDKTTHWKKPGVRLNIRTNSRRDTHFRKVLLSLFSFDLHLLQKQFEPIWQIDDTHWSIELKPKNPITRRALKNARLSGDEHIEEIEITTHKKEKLLITLNNIQTITALSHQQCVNLFGFSVDECNQHLISKP